MKAGKTIVLLAASLLLLAGGCKKEPGVLGKKVISGTVYFKNGATGANEAAPSAAVKIAYGTKGPVSGFDQTLLTGPDGTYSIEGLTKGDYFITAEYYDSHGFKYTTGGYSITINNKKQELKVDINLE